MIAKMSRRRIMISGQMIESSVWVDVEGASASYGVVGNQT